MRRLTELRIGEAGVITGMDVYNGCNRRLLAMGFTPGTQIQLCRRAPAGDPLLVRLRGLIAQLRSADFLKFDMGQVYMLIAIAILPVIVVYLLLSKFIVAGVALGGVKG